jgi:RNA polymerase sigma-70 factor (ECF subfamily)
MSQILTTYTDEQLVVVIRQKNEQSNLAFRTLYDRYAGGIYAYVLKILGDSEKAQDIFQETFIRFYQNVDVNYPTSNIHGFLVKIAKNLCLNAKRDEKKNHVPLEELDLHVSDSQNHDKTELLQLITMSLDLLDFDHREAFVLREYNGFSYEEIAKECGISVANAKTRVCRSKQKIKEILQPYLKELLRS